MPSVTSDTPDLGAFGEAVKLRLDDLGITQRQLGERVGQLHGREPYGQSTVGTWLARSEPTPDLVFDMERALEVEPGHLSKILGYVPVTVVSVPGSVLDAIEADPKLSEMGRSVLRAAYRELVR